MPTQTQRPAPRRALPVRALLCALACLLALAAAPPPTTATPAATADPYTVWTRFDAGVYALISDGDALWLAGSNRVTRWNLADGSADVFSVPQHAVLAAVRAPDGTLWFGGDAGLSRRAPDGTWQHLTAASDPLLDAPVVALAVTADGLLYMALGDLGGPLLRYDPAAADWQRFPNRNAAVAADYARVLTTLRPTALWTVQGTRVWLAWWVYDGAAWHNHPPAPAGDLAWFADPVTTPDGRLWTVGLARASVAHAVHEWDGTQWIEHRFDYLPVAERVTALAAAPDGALWIGMHGWSDNYGTATGKLIRWEAGSMTQTALDHPAAPIGFAMTGTTVAAAGAGWLWYGDRLYDVASAPLQRVKLTFVTRAGTHYLAGDSNALFAALQTVADAGSVRLEDDRWRTLPLPAAADYAATAVTAIEESPGGYVWVAGYRGGRLQNPVPPLLLTPAGDALRVAAPRLDAVEDIFAGDDRYTLFAWRAFRYGGVGAPGVWLLDNAGTPTDMRDDVWSDLGQVTGLGGRVARDATGRIWYGSSAGLFRHQRGAWVEVRPEPIDDLAVAADGTLFARSVWRVFVYDPAGGAQEVAISASALADPATFALLHQIEGHNQIVAHAADGRDWFLRDDAFLRCRPGDCERHPHAGDALARWSLDGYGRPWIVVDGAAWRLSRAPGFALAGASVWLAAPGTTRHFALHVPAWEGYAGAVDVALDGLPAGVTATLAPAPVAAGGTLRVTLTVAGDVPRGDYALRLRASAAAAPLDVTLRLVGAVVDRYLPVVRR